MPRTLVDTTLRLLDDLPPFEQGSKDIQAVVDVCAREVDRLDAARAQVRANFFPATADILLGLYEQELGLSVNPTDKTIEQRRSSVEAYLSKRDTGAGTDWQAAMTKLIGTSWSYEEHIPGDASSPSPNVIRILLPFTPQVDPPTSLTATAATGGVLSAGTYFYAVTATNAYGETTATAAVSITVAAKSAVELDWPDSPGATGYNVYRGASATTLGLLAAPSASAFTDGMQVGGAEMVGLLSPGQFPTSVSEGTPGKPPPAANTTEGFQAYEARKLARAITPAHVDLISGYTAGFILGISQLGDTL